MVIYICIYKLYLPGCVCETPFSSLFCMCRLFHSAVYTYTFLFLHNPLISLLLHSFGTGEMLQLLQGEYDDSFQLIQAGIRGPVHVHGGGFRAPGHVGRDLCDKPHVAILFIDAKLIRTQDNIDALIKNISWIRSSTSIPFLLAVSQFRVLNLQRCVSVLTDVWTYFSF